MSFMCVLLCYVIYIQAIEGDAFQDLEQLEYMSLRWNKLMW